MNKVGRASRTKGVPVPDTLPPAPSLALHVRHARLALYPGYSNYNSVAQFFASVLNVNMLENVLYVTAQRPPAHPRLAHPYQASASPVRTSVHCGDHNMRLATACRRTCLSKNTCLLRSLCPRCSHATPNPTHLATPTVRCQERKNMLYEDLLNYVTANRMLVTCCIDAHFTAFQVRALRLRVRLESSGSELWTGVALRQPYGPACAGMALWRTWPAAAS